VLCNPLTAAGTNRLPSTSELATCRQHLRATLAILRPRLVVTLGATALASLGAIAPHGLTLRLHVAQAVPWQGGLLLPLYHPGARACVHRPADQQLQDYVVWADLLRGLH
jgi:DNA polymerase